MLTVITPTTGKDSLINAINSIKNQKTTVPIKHIMLWDNKREGSFLWPEGPTGQGMTPEELNFSDGVYNAQSIVIKGDFVQGPAAGSSLRAVGLMIANTEWVTFMDDDVMWDSNHVETMMETVKNDDWGYCKRRIWTTDNNGFESLGVDEFESVGEDAKTPYKMVDNNSMFFRLKYGISAACLYRNTKEYNDDRLMYNFLMNYAGEPAKSGLATVNQVCPERLIEFFKTNCTKEDGN